MPDFIRRWFNSSIDTPSIEHSPLPHQNRILANPSASSSTGTPPPRTKKFDLDYSQGILGLLVTEQPSSPSPASEELLRVSSEQYCPLTSAVVSGDVADTDLKRRSFFHTILNPTTASGHGDAREEGQISEAKQFQKVNSVPRYIMDSNVQDPITIGLLDEQEVNELFDL